MRTLQELHQLALPRHGIVSTAGLRSLGIGPGAQHRLQQSGGLLAVHRGVFRLPGFPHDYRQKAAAALCVAGPDAIVSHRSAAFLLGAPLSEPSIVELIIDRRGHVRHAGVVAHQPTDRTDLRIVHQDGIRLCNPLRVLLDLGASSPPADVASALEHFLVEGRVSMPSVHAALERHSQRGRTGLAALRAVLRDQRLGMKPPDSVLELAFNRLVKRFGLPTPVFHHEIRLGGERLHPDFCWPQAGVVVEVDGWAYHSGRKQTENDRHRDLLLAAAGWLPIRVTWLKVTRRPAWVAGHLQRTLLQRLPAA